jgi:hypothetical protein
MASVLSQYGYWLLLILGAGLVVALLWTVLAALKSRRAAYYGLRQEAIRQVRRRALVSAVVLIAFAALAAAIDLQPAPSAATPVAVISTPTPIPPSPTVTPTRLPSSTPTTAQTLTPTSGPTQLPTSTLLPTPTRPATLPPQLLTPLPAAVSPAPNARLTFTTFASVLDNNNNPVDAGLMFPAGTRSVRVLFRAANVSNGVTWSILCHKNDQLVDSVAGPWQWGTRAQNARAFCAIDGSVGSYVVSAYLGLIKQFEATFDVMAATTTPAPTDTSAPTATPTP